MMMTMELRMTPKTVIELQSVNAATADADATVDAIGATPASMAPTGAADVESELSMCGTLDHRFMALKGAFICSTLNVFFFLGRGR